VNTKSPKVSVIIPAYNQAIYLGKAIQSALDQTYQDREIIVVNDGSTDNTAEIASHYQDQVIYIYQENRGLAGARNTAINNARGEFIALLDSDDVWLPEFLEKIVPVLSSNPQAAMVYSGYRYIDSKGIEIGIPQQKVVPPDLVYQTFVIDGNWINACTVVFRKNLAFEAGLFDEELKALEDFDLWIKLSRKGSVIGIPDLLVKYRRHDSNMTSDPGHMMRARLRLIEKNFGFLNGGEKNDSKKTIIYSRHFASGAKNYLVVDNFGESVNYFNRLLRLTPEKAFSMPVWRSFCRAHIPLEFSNDPSYLIDLEKMESTVLRFLDEIDNQLEKIESMKSMQCKIRISAYLALAEEGRLEGNFNFFQKYMYAILSLYPKAIFSRPFWGRVLRYFGAL
jgi:glycosyltransferase involved in cell wall biosynthesis